MPAVSLRRLSALDEPLARETFLMMGDVFDEEHAALSAPYLRALLERPDFFALAALAEEEVVGGLTAFVLPLTRLERREFFLYDIAVKPEWQRRGIGRMLVDHLRQAAAAEGIAEGFVLADNEDSHALDFYRALGAAAAPVTAFSFGAVAGEADDA